MSLISVMNADDLGPDAAFPRGLRTPSARTVGTLGYEVLEDVLTPADFWAMVSVINSEVALNCSSLPLGTPVSTAALGLS